MNRAARQWKPARLAARAAVGTALLALLASGAAAADSRGERDPYEYFFTPTFGDLPEEMAIARDDGKLGMMLFFESESCPYCEHMHRNVLNQPEVQDWYRERYVSIAVDIHGDVEVTDFDGISLPMKIFSDHRQVFLTPVMSFIDLEGNEIYRHHGMLKTPEEFLLLGEFIEGDHYFDTVFKDYARSRGVADEDEKTLATPSGEVQ